MMSTWTGAFGPMSWNARQRSSSYTTLAGISLLMTFRKMLSAIIAMACPRAGRERVVAATIAGWRGSGEPGDGSPRRRGHAVGGRDRRGGLRAEPGAAG